MNSTLELTLKSALKEALKAQDKERLDVIRGTLSACQYEAMQKGSSQITDELVTTILQREIKKRREEIAFADQANRADLREKPQRDIKILESFLPQQLSEAELTNIILELKSATPGTNLGAVMKVLKEKYQGQYDGKLASELGKKLLSA